MNPLNFFRRHAETPQHQAHMTWAPTSMGRSVSRAGVILRKQLWIWPIIAVVLLKMNRARCGSTSRPCMPALRSAMRVSRSWQCSHYRSGRIGESGETYAFNADGAMVSNSRFAEDLILLGLLPD